MQWEYLSKLLETKVEVSDGASRGVINCSDLTQGLNDLGNDKWELVSTTSISDGNVGTARLLFVFKRPVTPSP